MTEGRVRHLETGPTPDLRYGVVVPCKNEVEAIDRCLRALLGQRPAPSHLVVVDNGSDDGSLEVARALAGEVLERPPGVRISSLRNAGAGAVLEALPDVDVLAFVDADCEVSPGWAAAALEALGQGAELVGSRTRAAADDSWVARRWAAIEARQVHEGSKVWSQHLAMRRSGFQALGGFDEALVTGEDADLSDRVRQAGGEVRLVDAMDVVHHGFPSRLRDHWRRERWHTATPGWEARMSSKSRWLTRLVAAWLLVGAALGPVCILVRRHRPLAGWAAGSFVAVPLLGVAAGRSPRNALADGVLMTVWAGVRAVRLPGEVRSRR